MASAASVTQKPQAGPVELFRPRVMMEGLTTCLPQVPAAVREMIFCYGFEITAQDLLGRVEFYYRGVPGFPKDGIQVFFAYARIEKLFTALLVFGREQQPSTLVHVETCILSAAATTYFHDEYVRAGEKRFGCAEAFGTALWTLSLNTKVKEEIELAVDPKRYEYRLIVDTYDDSLQRCETLNSRTPIPTVEAAIAYAPQVGNMVRVRKILDELFQKHPEAQKQKREVTLYTSEREGEMLGGLLKEKISFAQMDYSDPSMPKFVQECQAKAESRAASQVKRAISKARPEGL